MTESEYRAAVAAFLVPYIGCKEGGTLHKQLIDMFNNSGLCTRYKMTTSDAWCATAVSDAFIGTGLTAIFPCVECSCANMVSLAKTAGIWTEDDAYTPKVGDVIMYDWDDTGGSKTDCTGTPDHVGIVTAISGTAFTVIEGNKSDTVGYRSMTVNGSYIRGYITPNYASISTGDDSGIESSSAYWCKNSTGWWYHHADGTWPHDCWELIDHHWYLFDSNGYMLTGWNKWNGSAIGEGDWYYLEETQNAYEGACYHEKAGNTGALEVWYVD